MNKRELRQRSAWWACCCTIGCLAVLAAALPVWAAPAAATKTTCVCTILDHNGNLVPDAVVSYVNPADKANVQAIPKANGTCLFPNLTGKVTLHITPATSKSFAPASVNVYIPPKAPVSHVNISVVGGKAYARVVPVLDGPPTPQRSWNDRRAPSSKGLLQLGGSCTAGDGDECDMPLLAPTDGVYNGTTTDNTGSTGDDTSCAFSDTIDEWYCYTAGCSGGATADTFGSGYDTTLAVYSACGGVELDCNDDTGGLQSQVSWTTKAGTNYFIRVSGFSDATGDYTLNIICQDSSGGPCPPAGNGDECDAPLLAPTEGVYNGTTNDNTGATGDDTSCTSSDTIDEWYCYTASCDGVAGANTFGSGYDTALAVFSSCGGLELACNDDTGGLQSAVSWAVTAGTNYLIRVSGFSGATGDYTLTINCQGAAANDDCANAELIDCNSTTIADNTTATTAPDDPAFSCIFGGPGQGVGSLWYQFVATDTSAFITTCGSVFPADDSVIAVYDGSCGSLVELGCSEDVCGLLSELSVGGLTVGNTYYIQLASFSDSDRGAYELVLQCPGPPPCIVDCIDTEGEPFCGIGPMGDTTNGGCNSAPPVYSPISCGDIVCGTGAFDGTTRDTDWYELTVTEDTLVTWRVTAEFDVLTFIITPGLGGDPCANVGLSDPGLAGPCEEVEISECLSAGTYWLFVAPDFTVPVACGAKYTAEVTCKPCVVPPGPCENPDAGDCFDPNGNGTPGCDDQACCELICSIDPFCCDVAWDGLCAEQALDNCEQAATGGCCFSDASCQVLTEEDCNAAGGEYQGDFSDCSGAPAPELCEPGTEDAVITIELLTDDFPGETTIELSEDGGGVIFSAGPFADPATLLTFDIPVCSTSCYTFTIFDAFGDGICCGFGLGAYTVLYNGNVVGSGGQFGDVDTVENIGDGCGGGGPTCEPGTEDATITIELLTDDFPGETTIELSEQGGGVVFSAGPFTDAATLHTFDVAVCSTSCYDFTIFDAFGDGICCGFGIGSYTVLLDGNIVGTGAEFGDSETVANIGGGCGSGTPLCQPGTEDAIITIELLTDDFPGETTIELSEQGGGVVFSAGPFADPATLLVFDIDVCLSSCYTFTIFDAFGDGICCGFGIGSYTVLLDGNEVGSGGEFGDVDTVENIGDGCGAGSACPPGTEDATVTIELLTDDFPGETTIELSEDGRGEVFSAGPFADAATLFTFDIPVCSSSCYTFTIFDSFGDGLCCGFGMGSYTVLYNGNIVGSGGSFDDVDTVENIGDGCFPFQGGCCLPDGSCLVTTEACCLFAGGQFAGFGVLCNPSPCVIEGNLDIKPGSCPNSFNRGSNGVLPVALIGSVELDVSMVDLTTVQIARADGMGGSIGPNEGPPGPHSVIDDVATAFDGDLCDCHELSGDGVDDLSMKFNSADLVDALQLNGLMAGDLVELTVTGFLMDGRPFSASDCIRLVPPGTAGGQLNITSSGANPVLGGSLRQAGDAALTGAWVDVTPEDSVLDGGGFTGFQRSYPLGSAVTIKAGSTHNGQVFDRFIIDGVAQSAGLQAIPLTINGTHDVVVKYRIETRTRGPVLGGSSLGGGSPLGD